METGFEDHLFVTAEADGKSAMYLSRLCSRMANVAGSPFPRDLNEQRFALITG